MRFPSPWRSAGLALLVLVFAGCAASSKIAPASSPAASPTAPPEVPLDASYDWHGLLTAPFGRRLGDFPDGLHEVLLFHDVSHPAAPADDAECYATPQPAPRFLGTIPDDYLLCFKYDRLARIEVAVRLPAPRAGSVLAAACELWSKNAARPGPRPYPAGSPDAPGTCEGRDADVAFSAHLEESPEPATRLYLRLDSLVRP
jgi:hypothetical protein